MKQVWVATMNIAHYFNDKKVNFQMENLQMALGYVTAIN